MCLAAICAAGRLLCMVVFRTNFLEMHVTIREMSIISGKQKILNETLACDCSNQVFFGDQFELGDRSTFSDAHDIYDNKTIKFMRGPSTLHQYWSTKKHMQFTCLVKSLENEKRGEV